MQGFATDLRAIAQAGSGSASLRAVVDAYDPSAPLDRAWTIPASWYVDPRIAALENRTTFRRTWQLVGRADQVVRPGQYLTDVIAGEPIVVVRGEDGALRAFYNVCRHHAAAVMTEPAGEAKHLRCPYHGWTYGLDGALRGTPDFADVCDFDKASNGLVPIAVAVWESFVFVRLEAEDGEASGGKSPRNTEPAANDVGFSRVARAAQAARHAMDPHRDRDAAEASLKASLGADLVAEIARLNLSQFHFQERRRYAFECNWKVFVDNYLDGGYHVPYLHKGLDSVLDYSRYTIENGARHCLQKSPIVREGAEPQTGAVRQGDVALYYWMHPNFMINWYEGVMDTNLVRPLGVDKTEVIFDFYFTDVGTEEARARNRASIDVGQRIQDEDTDICRSVQRGLTSSAYRAGRLSVRREAGEHLFHRLLHADLASGLDR